MAFTLEELSILNVHELRARAREVGVRAPTTKRQKELIDEIIKIQAGELLPHESNMGRPVKTGIRTEILKKSTTLIKDNYSNVGIEINVNKFNDCNLLPIINGENTVKCAGIIRKIDGRFYIQNYLGNCKYILIYNEQIKENGLCEGDYIEGVAKVRDKIFGDFITTGEKKINKSNILQPKELKIVNLKNDDEIYEYISKDKKINKIILEIECNRNLAENFSDCIVIKTNECEDVKVSFNTLLDCKKFIQNLCEKNVDFIIYVINTEYIYSILTVYYNYLKMDQDLNAGQYFKEILSLISNNQKGSIVLFEKEKCRRSSYLDIIINKYCEQTNDNI